MRFLFAFLIAFIIAAMAFRSPVYGFAFATAVIALLSTYTLDLKKLKNERPYYTGATFSNPFIFLSAATQTVIRAVGIGAIALFTLPASEANDLKATSMIFIATVAIGLLGAFIIDGFTGRRGNRWALYRFIVPLGLTFSALTFAAQQATADDAALFTPPNESEIIASLNAIRGTVRRIEGNEQRIYECDSEREGELLNIPGRILAHRIINGCENLERSAPSPVSERDFSGGVKFISQLDSYIDDKIVTFFTAIVSASLKEPMRIFASIFLSSNIVQGFVLALYVALFSNLLHRRNND